MSQPKQARLVAVIPVNQNWHATPLGERGKRVKGVIGFHVSTIFQAWNLWRRKMCDAGSPYLIRRSVPGEA